MSLLDNPVVMGPALLTTEGEYAVRISLGDAAVVHETFLVRKTAVPEVRASAICSTEMVIARFASHPVAGNAANDPTSLPAYEALAKHLMGKK